MRDFFEAPKKTVRPEYAHVCVFVWGGGGGSITIRPLKMEPFSRKVGELMERTYTDFPYFLSERVNFLGATGKGIWSKWWRMSATSL